MTNLTNSVVLETMEDFFISGEVTTRVAQALDELSESYVFVESPGTDSAVHDNYGLFRKYSAFIDSLLEEFCSSVKGRGVAVASLVAACNEELKACAGVPSSWTWVPYINAALCYEEFCQLVEDTKALKEYMVEDDDDAGEEVRESDEVRGTATTQGQQKEIEA